MNLPILVPRTMPTRRLYTPTFPLPRTLITSPFPVSDPTCPNCGWVLRWLSDKQSWGCDHCRALIPVIRPQPAQYVVVPTRTSGSSKLPLIIGGAAVVLAGVAVVLLMLKRGGGASTTKT